MTTSHLTAAGPLTSIRLTDISRGECNEIAGEFAYDPALLRPRRVMLAGAGNIGSHSAELLARMCGTLLIVDRDRVEEKNVASQAFSAADIGAFKAEALAARIRGLVRGTEIGFRAVDLEDLPGGELDGIDVVVAGLDSLRARQIAANDLALPRGVPVVDGAVGEPLVGRVRVLVPGGACLECSWGKDEYRQLAAEHPCIPGGAAGTKAPPTGVPAMVGAMTAAVMCAEAARLFCGEDVQRKESVELHFDLGTRRQFVSRLKRSSLCRHDHVIVGERLLLEGDFESATAAGAAAAIRRRFGDAPLTIEARRGLFDNQRFLSLDRLAEFGSRRLSELGMQPKDQLRLRDGTEEAFLVVVRSANKT